MKPSHFLPAAIAFCVLGVAACGNKGPLVRASDVPPPAVQAAPAPAPAPAAADATLPDLTPPAQPPVTDTAAPAPATDATATDPAGAATAPPAQDDGD